MDAIVPPSPLPPTPQRPRYLPAFARTLTTPVTVLAPSLSRPLEPSTTQTLANPASVTLPPKPPYRDEEGDVGHQLGSASASDYTVEDIIKWQIQHPTQLVPIHGLDALLTLGIGDYSYVTRPAGSSSRSGSDPVAGEQDAPPNRVSLGKGKFSEVLLATKGETFYALKLTPLHSHHPLIATRLLREPTILAQLLPHPNLVQVFEAIRTPGHFYLVEEDLSDSVTLEALVLQSAGGILDIVTARSVLSQLASVIRSLHEPLRVCHRDIKPENVLVKINPASSTSGTPQVVLKLLDFGLATHFSASEAKLTTCCGSPAYHSPELWRGLREPSGTVRYWGPEVDIWCLGLTLLRCLTPNKYPLGIAHTSVTAISDKVADALLSVEDETMRRTLTGFMVMSGKGRMDGFDEYCRVADIDSRLALERNTGANALEKRDFKSTTFLPTEARHGLDLRLLPPISAGSPSNNEEFERTASVATSRNSSRGRTTEDPATPLRSPLLPPGPIPGSPNASPPPSLRAFSLPDQLPLRLPIELELLNPANEDVLRAASYIKYLLRCAGILYHVRKPSPGRKDAALHGPTPKDEQSYTCYLQCVVELPPAASPLSKASTALASALRPGLLRSQTTGPQVGGLRSSSTPAASLRLGKQSKVEEAPTEALVFYLSITKPSSAWNTPVASPTFTSLSLAPPSPLATQGLRPTLPATPKSRTRPLGDRIIVGLSDRRALQQVERALQAGRDLSPGDATSRGRTLKGESLRARRVSASREEGEMATGSIVKAKAGTVPRGEGLGLATGDG